ncbi:Signal recognition particle receptor subunit beta [Spatholobus suberectus]|nr:Signal recognition particle receptor subunit beta [Spatholobus suberectus]
MFPQFSSTLLPLSLSSPPFSSSQVSASLSPLLLFLFYIYSCTISLPLLLPVRLFKRTKSNTIVLTGLTGAGKTVLFYQLRDGSIHEGTVTSMEPNEDTFVLHSETTQKRKVKPVRVVDVPGHSRLRPKLDEYLPQAAAVVFAVDAVDFLSNCRAASEYLYDILTKGSVVRKKIPLLILCNKMDKVTAHSKEFICKQMGKEIDKLRASRSAVSEADVANEFTLGVSGEPFSFSQCHNKVRLQDASGLTGEISQLEQFIREYVKP